MQLLLGRVEEVEARLAHGGQSVEGAYADAHGHQTAWASRPCPILAYAEGRGCLPGRAVWRLVTVLTLARYSLPEKPSYQARKSPHVRMAEAEDGQAAGLRIAP